MAATPAPCATACCGSFGMREIVEPRRVISGVFATYEGNTKLFSPQTTHSLVSHADTPRHGHGSLPRTEAAPTERTRHASGYGCSRAAQWLLYHRLPDPQLSPVAITPTTGWRIRTLCRKARWPPRSNERVCPCDEGSAGGRWLSPPATDPCLLPVTSASETRARCRQRGVCRAAQPPRRIFWPEEVWRPSFVTRGAKLRVWRQRLTPLTRPRRSDCARSHDLKPTAFGRSCSRPADPRSGKKFCFAGPRRVGGAP